MKKRRLIFYTVMGILGAVMISATAAAAYYAYVTDRTLNEVTSPEQAGILFSVYVSGEDPAQTLEDIKGYPVGISRYDTDRQKFIAEKLEEAAGEPAEFVKYKDGFSLMDSLKNKKNYGIIFNEALLESIQEEPGYEWTQEGIRKVGSFEWKQEISRPEEPGEEKTLENFLVYISGIDTYGDVSLRSRSDVNLLAAVNGRTRQITLVATPRDFYVEFSGTNGQKDKLTHAGIYGADASVDALEKLYGVNIDYYVKMNFSGFMDIIDALGGVEVYSEYDFTVENVKHYKKGYNQLNGIEALAFARERKSFAQGDYQRAAHQMEVIRGVLKKCSSPAILGNYAEVMEGVGDCFETNMSKSQIRYLAGRQILSNKEWSVESYTVRGEDSSELTYSMPGRKLYVILPDPDSVSRAAAMLNKTAGL